MCKTYNKIGSLTTLKLHLEKNNIHEFKSLKEVIGFQKSYAILRQQLISDHENLIEQEKNRLDIDLPNLGTTIQTQRQESVRKLTDEIDKLRQQLNIITSNSATNFFYKLSNRLRTLIYKIKISQKEGNFEIEVKTSIRRLVEEYEIKNNRYQFISTNFKEAVKQSVQHLLLELERKKTAIDEANNYIHGALGEQKIAKILESLSNDYFLINDFAVSFSPAIYNRQQNDYINSIQIDHLLVGPSGIFVIETKNWSEKSLKNLSLRSPVEQIRRTSFALFYLLNSDMSDYHLQLDKHHWGEKKIPIKNLIVFTNNKPKEEFQYVKILTANELITYVNYFKPIFSYSETERIADMILMINDSAKANLPLESTKRIYKTHFHKKTP